MDMFTLNAANKNAERLVAGLASGVKSHEVDNENGAIKFNFNDGSSTKLQVQTPQAKVEKAVNAYLTENLYVNAKDYGAVGDGITDDTIAIKNALLGAIEKGLKLYVPAGVYRINDKVNITDKSYIEMYGDGQDKTIFKAVDGLAKGSDMFTFWRIKHAIFHDFTVDGNSEVNTDGNDIDGIHMFDTWNCEDIEIYNVTWQNNVYIGTRHANVKNLNIHHCKTSSTDVGICTISDTAENVEIKECQVEGHSKSEGISIYNKVLIKNVVIRDNIVQNKEKAMGICIGYQFDNTVINTQNVTIDNNKIFNTAAGIAVLNPGGVSESVFVTNNVIATASTNASHGISFKNAKNCKITNNIINKACLRGISLVGCDNVSVTNNTVMNYDAGASNAINSAIALEDSNNCIVQENTIQQNLEESNNGVLLIKGTSSKNVFKNNKILPSDINTKAAVINVSSGSVATDNIIEFDYSGILIGVSGMDYTTNKVIVNNYTDILGNAITLYNKPYINNILLKITKSGVVVNPALAVLHEGAKKKIKVEASYAFTLTNSDSVIWDTEGECGAGTYLVELQCVGGTWYETFKKKIA